MFEEQEKFKHEVKMVLFKAGYTKIRLHPFNLKRRLIICDASANGTDVRLRVCEREPGCWDIEEITEGE